MKTRIEELLLKRLMQMLTPEEATQLEDFRNQSEANRELVDSLKPGKKLYDAVTWKLDVEGALEKTKQELFGDS